jgi:tetratricopeptide (TPR) repeat protein
MRYKLLGIAVLVAVLLPSSTPAKGFTSDLPPDARESFLRAQRALIDGDRDGAAREFERVIELAPDYPGTYHLYAYALTGNADALKAAAERFRKLAEANPDNPVYWYAYGRLEQDAAAREGAFDKVVALAPNEPWGYFGQAFVARITNKPDKALPLYEKARALAPNDPSIASGLAGAYGAAERPADVKKIAEEILKTAPDSYEADSTLATLMRAAPENERMAVAERYVKLFPSGTAVEQAHWTVLEEVAKKDAAAAAARARDALAGLTGPRFVEFRGYLFNEYVLKPAVEKGQPAVDKLAEEVLASKEPSPGVFLFLGQAYANDKADPKTAIRLLSRGLELHEALPKDKASADDGAAFRYELGRAHLRAGDAARAVELLETVAEGENFGPAAAAAGKAHMKLGNTAKAYEALTRAVAVSPTPEANASLAEAAKAAGRTTAEAEAAVWSVRDAAAKPAADFTLTSLDGKEVSLASYKGKVVLLNFWFPG